jgi:hypothetical protein
MNSPLSTEAKKGASMRRVPEAVNHRAAAQARQERRYSFLTRVAFAIEKLASLLRFAGTLAT